VSCYSLPLYQAQLTVIFRFLMTSWQDEFSVEVEDIQQVLVVKKATLGESFFEFWQDPRLYYRFVCGLKYDRSNTGYYFVPQIYLSLLQLAISRKFQRISLFICFIINNKIS